MAVSMCCSVSEVMVKCCSVSPEVASEMGGATAKRPLSPPLHRRENTVSQFCLVGTGQVQCTTLVQSR